MRLIHWLFAICLFTASCDLVLVFDVGGVLRLAQILMIIVVIGGLAKSAQSGTFLWPQGGMALVIWCATQVLFLPASIMPSIGVAYYLLLFFTIFGVFAVLQLYGRSDYVESLMKIYLASYVFVGFFGLFQQISPALHLGTFFAQQWILPGKFPRINGFSYEPSYFATYMVMGWIMLLDLRASKAQITRSKKWKWFAFMLGAVMFLSTSRTAWLIMVVEGIARGGPIALRASRREIAKLRLGYLRLPIPHFGILVLIGLVLGAGTAAAVAVSSVVDPTIFLNGTGLGNTSAHSVNDRSGRTGDTFAVFLEHPLMGQSLTGVAGRVAERHGERFTTVEDLRMTWGFPVILEVLAASGVIGVIPFLWFFTAITVGNFRLIHRCWPEETAKWLRALVRAMIFECLILLGNQNLQREYLWFHVTMVVVVGFNLRYERRSDAQRNSPSLMGREELSLGDRELQDLHLKQIL
jgi:hypothetical protein